MAMKGLVRICLAGLVMLAVCSCAGCGKKEADGAKQDLEFTVVDEGRLPEELKKIVDEKKKGPFNLTYADGGYMYLCVGYGKQNSGGYSISVNELYATPEEIYLDTNLIGPREAEPKGSEPSYPYIVIKTPFVDKTVVFD